MSDTVQEIIVGIVIACSVVWCLWRIFSYRHHRRGECDACPIKERCNKDKNECQ